MNRRTDDEFLARMLSKDPTSTDFAKSSSDGGLECRRVRVPYIGSATAKDARLRGLRKWHSANILPPSVEPSCDGSRRGITSGPMSMSTSAIGVSPIIEELGMASSRWESLPSTKKHALSCNKSTTVSHKIPGVAPCAKKLGLPKPPRRQRSMESIGDGPC